MLGQGSWPVWLLVILSGLAGQMIKLLVYSVLNRHLMLAVLARSFGLPSLQANILSCLLVVVVMRSGWATSAAGFALVFAVIGIHDRVKLRLASERQREAVFHLVASLPEAGHFQQRVADYLDPRTHHPVHVVSGVAFGGLFGLAFGSLPG
jgi:acid phosphatase family membrane protein YuiD